MIHGGVSESVSFSQGTSASTKREDAGVLRQTQRGQNGALTAAIRESGRAREGVGRNRTKTKTQRGTFASLAQRTPAVACSPETRAHPRQRRGALALPLMNIHPPH